MGVGLGEGQFCKVVRAPDCQLPTCRWYVLLLYNTLNDVTPLSRQQVTCIDLGSSLRHSVCIAMCCASRPDLGPAAC